MKPQTLFDKLWESHVVQEEEGFPAVLYIDAHLIHEVTTPQAFSGLKKRGIGVSRTDRTWATMDHNTPTKDIHLPIKEALSAHQVETLRKNCEEFGVRLYGLGHPWQGIVHVIGPELGITKPGMTIVCGDSHTSSHGAFGSIAFGIGTSEVEQVLASQCILQQRPKTMRVEVNGDLGAGVTAKDVILYVISKLGVGGCTGYFVEYAGSTIDAISMEGRMTICNMSIEMGARGGMVAVDEKTLEFVKGREWSPKGEEWDKAVEYWKTLRTDEGAEYDRVEIFDAGDITPMITYGTNPGMGMKITDSIPEAEGSEDEKKAFMKAMQYMGLDPGTTLLGRDVDYVFMGSCTNSRMADFRAAAEIIKGKRKADGVEVFVVPGSAQVLKNMREEGIVQIFEEAGFDVREAGCSACLGMNEDKIPSGKLCVSTSNRNFEGRQGPGARTLLASPLTAAAAAITGKVTDPRTVL